MITLIVLKVFLMLVQNSHCIEETIFDAVSAKAPLVKLDPPGKVYTKLIKFQRL